MKERPSIHIKEAMREVMSEKLSRQPCFISEAIEGFFRGTTKEERSVLHTDYRDIMWSTPIDYNNPLTFSMFTILDEGLVRSYPIEKTVEYVKSYLHLHSAQIKIEKTKTGAAHIVLIIPNIQKNIYHVDNAMRLCGYFRSSTRIKILKDRSNRDVEWVVVQYEAEFQSNSCSNELRQERLPIIHLTPYYNIEKIKANGLVPRCKNDVFKYPERIYFLKSSVSQQEMDLVGRVLYSTSLNKPVHTGRHLPKGYQEGDYAVIYVDLNKIPERVEFYPDPNMLNAVFTMENIPPSAIMKIEKRHYEI